MENMSGHGDVGDLRIRHHPRHPCRRAVDGDQRRLNRGRSGRQCRARGRITYHDISQRFKPASRFPKSSVSRVFDNDTISTFLELFWLGGIFRGLPADNAPNRNPDKGMVSEEEERVQWFQD